MIFVISTASFRFKSNIYEVDERNGSLTVTVMRGDYIERGAKVRKYIVSLSHHHVIKS